MDCSTASSLLVGYQDSELSPSESLLVEQHLTRCVDCRQLDRRLAALTPAPGVLPEALLQEQWDKLDAALETAMDSAPQPPSLPSRWTRAFTGWLRRETEVTYGAVLAYAALLLFAVSWSLSLWSQPVPSDAPGVQITNAPAATAPAPWPKSKAPADPLPAKDFVPASYSPERAVF